MNSFRFLMTFHSPSHSICQIHPKRLVESFHAIETRKLHWSGLGLAGGRLIKLCQIEDKNGRCFMPV